MVSDFPSIDQYAACTMRSQKRLPRIMPATSAQPIVVVMVAGFLDMGEGMADLIGRGTRERRDRDRLAECSQEREQEHHLACHQPHSRVRSRHLCVFRHPGAGHPNLDGLAMRCTRLLREQ